jgi:hypothetical protein
MIEVNRDMVGEVNIATPFNAKKAYINANLLWITYTILIRVACSALPRQAFCG